MNNRLTVFGTVCVLLVAMGSAGCRRNSAQDSQTQLQIVTVSVPVVKEVRDYVDFNGRTEAPESVDIRARVTGYLENIFFEEGFEVKKDAPLFQIDPRPFQAQYDQSLGQLEVRKANLEDQRAEFTRAKALRPKNAIAQSDYDRIAAQYGEAVASVAAAEAAVRAAKLNLDFAAIASPIAGRISRAILTKGNLVKADDTLLTTVVSQHPMYVYFDVDERTMLRVTRMQLDAKENLLHAKKVPVLMGLSDEEGFPHTGFVNFADNVVDSSTGTILARGVFDNLASPAGARLLRPGMFVRVRLPLGKSCRSVLVAERALGTDQGKKYVLVVDHQGKVQNRPVSVGPVQDGGMRVITEGLDGGERVIVSGLQLVRPNMEVQIEEVAMPQQAVAGPGASGPTGAVTPVSAPPSPVTLPGARKTVN